MASQRTHADRIALLKRLGFQLSRTGRTFSVIDKNGALAIGSRPAMTLAEIERWIGERVEARAETCRAELKRRGIDPDKPRS
jgi:hypothetical protein